MFLRATLIVAEEMYEFEEHKRAREHELDLKETGDQSILTKRMNERGETAIPPHFPFFTTVPPPACFPSGCLTSRSPFFELPFGEAGDGNLALIMIGLTIETIFRPPLIPTILLQCLPDPAVTSWSYMAVIHAALLQTRAHLENPEPRFGHPP